MNAPAVAALFLLLSERYPGDTPGVALFFFLSVGAVALFSFIAVVNWAESRRKEREAYYRSETLKKIVESPGAGATAALEFLREEEKNRGRKAREGLKLGGLIMTGIGIGVGIMFWGIKPATALVGAIPLFIGLAMLAYALYFAPQV